MRLRAADARRILSFCLDRPFDVELSDQGRTCTIRLSPLSESGPAGLFEADTFEQALRAAADAGLVRRQCIERQIAFYTSGSERNGERSYDAKAGAWSGPPLPGAPDIDLEAGPGRDLSLAHYRGLAELRYQIRRFVGFSERAARAAGLEPPQHQLLLAIYGLPPGKRPTLATVAERMCLDLEPCQALVDSLLARALVRWTVNPSDRRERLLALTDAGLTALRSLTSLHRNQVLAVGPTFVQALGAILSSFEDND